MVPTRCAISRRTWAGAVVPRICHDVKIDATRLTHYDETDQPQDWIIRGDDDATSVR